MEQSPGEMTFLRGLVIRRVINLKEAAARHAAREVKMNHAKVIQIGILVREQELEKTLMEWARFLNQAVP